MQRLTPDKNYRQTDRQTDTWRTFSGIQPVIFKNKINISCKLKFQHCLKKMHKHKQPCYTLSNV